MTPYIEVSHLPSATSFYSAVVQPLGLKAIAPKSESDSTLLPTAVGFGGVDNAAVFEIRQTSNPLKPPRLSSLTLAVPSNSAVTRFHKSWLKAEPPSWSLFRDNRGLEKLPGERHRALQGPWSVQEGGETAVRAIVFDQDGNKLEAWCPGTSSRPGAPEVVKWTNPFDRQISQQDFPIQSRARSQFTSNASSEHSRSQTTAMRPPQVSPAHSANHTSGPSTRSSQEEAAASQSESSYGGAFNTTTMVGALLGAAAGAALTYGYVTGNQDPSASEEHEPQRQRVLPRRATFPEKPVIAHRYPHRRPHEKRDLDGSSIPRRFSTADARHLPSGDGYDEAMDDDNVSYGVEPVHEPRYLTYPPLPASVASHTYTRAPSTARALDNGGDLRDHRSRVSTHAPDGAREYRSRPPSSVAEDTHDRRSRPPSSVAKDTHDRRSRAPSRMAEDASARRSRPSSRVSGRRNSTGRARSEVAHERVRHPAYDHERDYQSVAALPRRAPGSTVSRPPLTRVFRPHYESDQETFVSARSHHSASTVRSRDRPMDREHGRDLGHEFPDYEAVTREYRTPRSEVSAATLREASQERPRRGSSRVSARNVPLPRSMVGSSHANWNPWDVPLPMSGVGSSHADWDDDMVSLAPSDSISCVGSKAHRSRKQRY